MQWHETSHPEPWFKGLALAVLWIAVTWLLMVGLSGCTATVTPTPVRAAQAGFSGDTPAAGLSVTPKGPEIDQNDRLRYNALVDLYGDSKWSWGVPRFIPPVRRDAGLTQAPDGGWLIDKEHFVDFGLMAEWARGGVKP